MPKVDAAGDGEAVSGLPRAPVEARSLSSITAIASNPPAYPRNPAQKKLDPLVLYIVRVPGSRDVFLTPLKPPTKSSVSAEAINASLYYLHVATPEDEALLQEYEQERAEEARKRKETQEDDPDAPLASPPHLVRLNNVRRKPVPGGANAAASPKLEAAVASPPLSARPLPTSWQSQEDQSPSQTPNTLQRPYLPFRPSFQGTTPGEPSLPTPPPHLSLDDRESILQLATRNPYGDCTSTVENMHPHTQLPAAPQGEPAAGDTGQARRPNRWSAALSGYISRGQESWKEKYEALPSNRNSLDTRRPRMRPEIRPHSAHGSPSHSFQGSPARSPGHSPSRRPQEHQPPRDIPGFHITVIRRDPTHGSQWNVATISTPRLDGSAFDIEISTPGYNRFLAQDEPFSLASLGVNLSKANGRPPSLASFKLPASIPPGFMDPIPSPNPTSGVNNPSQPRRFRRKLCVSRPYFQDEPRGGSLDLNRAAPDHGGSGSPSKALHSGMSKLKSGYYTFTSPWNGICTFSTSVNGRSLKCKHMIPTHGAPHHSHSRSNDSHPNPFPSSTSAAQQPESPAVTVAEIRFNTPFQAGHIHQPPGPSHHSPFALSQTTPFRDLSNPQQFTPPGEPSYLASPQTPTSATSTTSKRNSLAQFLNPNTYTRPRARSGASTSSIGTSAANVGDHPPKQHYHKQQHTRNPSASSTSSGAGDPFDDPHHVKKRETLLHHRRASEDERLDFSLARERAGGGMRGKSAKLGKLVIEDEGIKMLDLVVAACMAVWWRGYYY
ncbi:uncharacterized protein BP01DRAFT_337203 [Aspergillus saccharolyticus JOP 1030-1]|uniref:Uncharacterized protein n=1 Tax=Aspergillus saccharolyticus JOP 1030-1 TaxID=1450539 RepID=A0A318ZIW6_9EURO|nr:hypothetical protein BP01DRAFT_337203 [Aspergillus saccharolyticus JOP 1030-1]PYH46805.1 hypothetical protein BP01DRAFT_337203 [Aspergillus saccharolyticus JOP 1030-1]